MFYLPLPGRIRFAALTDTPDVEDRLGNAFARSNPPDWTSFLDDFSDVVIDGEPQEGILFKRGKSFVVGDVGNPQVDFDGTPPTVLIVYSTYQSSVGPGSISYRRLTPGYFRWRIDPSALAPVSENLDRVYKDIQRLKDEKYDEIDADSLEESIRRLNLEIRRLSQRQDPLDTILPALTAEAAVREQQIQDLQQQIDSLQPSVRTGTLDLTNVYFKNEINSLLAQKVSQGLVDAAVAGLAKQVDFEAHILAKNPHDVNYVDVGAASRAEYDYLIGLIASLVTRIQTLEGLDPVRNITTQGGLLATEGTSGTWNIDASGLEIGGHGAPQETEFFRSGLLAVELGEGRWYAWDDLHIVGVRIAVDQVPTGAPVVVDILKNGYSIYTTAVRPTIPDGGPNAVLAALPDDLRMTAGDYLSIQIVQVGTLTTGSGLSLQVRYEFDA